MFIYTLYFEKQFRKMLANLTDEIFTKTKIESSSSVLKYFCRNVLQFEILFYALEYVFLIFNMVKNKCINPFINRIL